MCLFFFCHYPLSFTFSFVTSTSLSSNKKFTALSYRWQSHPSKNDKSLVTWVVFLSLAGHVFQHLRSLLLLLLSVNVLRPRNPCTWVLVGQSFLSNMREVSGFLPILMSTAAFSGSVFMPVLSSRSNFIVRYCLTSQVKRTASLLGLCSAQPSYRSVLLFVTRC